MKIAEAYERERQSNFSANRDIWTFEVCLQKCTHNVAVRSYFPECKYR